EKLIYISEKMDRVCDLAREAARTEQPVLIQGETGTGKELLARAVHFHSRRRNGPFLIQNCHAMTDSALQAELFGQEGAKMASRGGGRTGLIHAADGGTLLLDEISEISPSLQGTLLCFLQTGEIKPAGAIQAVRCDVRLLATTSRPLAEIVSAGKFRQDLYFR